MPFRLLSLLLLILTWLVLNQPAHAATYTPQGDLIGEVSHYTVRNEDNLYEIARRFDLGIVEILAANPGVDPWQPKPGTKLTLTMQHVLPPVRTGIVLNLSELRMFYFRPDGSVMIFPIGIGREGWQTPTGVTSITRKRKDPAWIPPPSIRKENPALPEIVPAGPENPLGAYALNLGWPGYVIHGTNRPYGIGKRSSHGCIRLYPEDIETLFSAVETGTPVTVIDTPYKVGWKGDTLYLEVTQTQEQADIIAAYGDPACHAMPEIYDAVREAAGMAAVDWYTVEQTMVQQNGIPTAIGKKP